MFEVGKYKNKWAIFDSVACVWYFIKGGKKECQKLCDKLNNERG